MLSPRWSHDPLSGAGAARAGGRWNQPGQATLYVSDSYGTAIAEYHQNLPRPGTLAAYDIKGGRVLDLADTAIQCAIGIDAGFLRQPWKTLRNIQKMRPPAWDFANAAHSAGWHGLRVPSVQASGLNLVLWKWNQGDAPRIECFDPLGDLPRNQTSWNQPN